jgi:hypothetical protein
MARILIAAGTVSVQAEFDDGPTARAIADVLPLQGSANVWGDEIYFDIPVTLEETADARQDVEVGALGYWPVGKAFCIFFGPTPVSTGDKPRAYSPVNVFGRVLGDATVFKAVPDGTTVKVSRAAD